jgi:ribose transport system substrate-binding protein
MIAQYRAPLSFTAPGPAIKAASVKGKTVAIISVDQRVPTLAQAATAMQQAASTAGLKTTLFDAQANPSRMVQGIQQAVNQHAGAAILLGIPTTLVPGPIKSLVAAGIPSVTVLNNDPIKGVPGQGSPDKSVYATSAPSYTTAGELEACTAVVKTKGKATVAIMSTPDIDPAKFVVQGARKIFAQCGGCQVKATTQTPLANWTTALPGLAQSTLRRNPDINFLVPVLDQMALFVATGVRQSATKVPVVSFNGTPAVLSLVQKGDVIVADPGEDNTWIGWHTIDQAMRGMLKMSPADPAVPIRYFDKSNLAGLNVNDGNALYGSSFIAGYKRLWGVG